MNTMQLQPYLSPELSQRFAAIDIGSNSIRLVVAEALRGGRYRVLDEERESTRLGGSLASTGMLTDDAMSRTLTALRRFRKIAEGLQVRKIRAIATCAVREARNGSQFARRASEEVGLPIEIISAQMEADLAFYSVRRSFDLTGKDVVLADIGGGSTEIILASGPHMEAAYTTKLGALRTAERFGGEQASAGSDYKEMTRWIARHLRKKTRKPALSAHLLIGSGGTFTSLATMCMAANNQQGLPVRGYQVSRAELKHLLDRLSKLSTKNRRSVPGLDSDRADIIVPGLAVIDAIMRRFRVNRIQVHNRGVRDGLLLSMINKALGKEQEQKRDTGPDREIAIVRFAQACGADLPHGMQTAHLAGRIFEQLVEAFDLDAGDQLLLETAAKLQDVGYLINYDQHHKHSYHLILNSHLEAFRPLELEVIANLARYHRRSVPKMKHANFRQLSPESRRRVRQMAAILRLAGGLDRSHSQSIRDVSVRVASKHETIDLGVQSENYPEVDIWGARRRTRLFEDVFHTSLNIEWTGSAQKTARSAGRRQPTMIAT